jgi:NADH dehydrogenase (ubiquinone) 1 alpha subcomplex subunit 6
MYSLNLPVSAIRTKIRQQFEKHRYVSQINVVDVLLYKSNAEFQVCLSRRGRCANSGGIYANSCVCWV